MRAPMRILLLSTLLAAGTLAVLGLVPSTPSIPAARAQSGGGGAPPSACGLTITETAPASVRVCDEAAVTVTMVVTRPKPLPLHVVFLVARHLLMFDHLDEAKAVARDAANALEFTNETRVGVVSLSVQSRTEQELTSDKGKVLSAINSIRLDQVNPTARYYDWLADAEDLLAEARSEAISPVEIIVLISTGCPAGFESYCQRQQASAGRVQGKGVTVIGVCNPNAVVPPPALPRTHCNDIRAMASQGSYYDLRQGSRVQARLLELEQQGKDVAPEVVRLIERLAPGFTLVAGSAAGAPASLAPRIQINSDRMLWEWQDVPADSVLTATYRVKPRAEGPAQLRLADSAGMVEDNLQRVSAPYLLPTRTLQVLPCAPPTPTESPAPSATATTAPSDTPRPTATVAATATSSPSVTPSPTATSRPGRAYLPALMRRACKPAAQHTDVILAIDASSSMAEAAGSGTRMDAARAAARRFIELLALDGGGDQAALIAFNSQAQVLAPLGDDRAALLAALDRIGLERGTRIDLALDGAGGLLSGPSVRPLNNQVIVLLTDGRPDQGQEGATLEAARRAGVGREVYVIGLGDAVGADLMRQVASRPETYLSAPGPQELRMVYEAIAGQLPCPGGVIWGGF
jgi:Mg-chelatase subunit ChlD